MAERNRPDSFRRREPAVATQGGDLNPIGYYVGQARSFRRALDGAARMHGARRLPTALRLRRLRRRLGFEYDEALGNGLLDPALSPDERARHVSWTRLHEVQTRLNPRDFEAVAHQKAIFYRWCEQVGVRAPVLYATVSPGSGGVDDRGDVQTGPADFRRLVERLPAEFVVKPSDGHFGHGVTMVRRRDDGRLEVSGGPITAEELYARMAGDPDYETFVVQERLANHRDLVGLVPTPTLHTARIATLVDRDGSVEVLYGLMKLALGSAEVDNFREGATGNGLALIGLADGRLGELKMVRPGGVGLAPVPAVPDTGTVIEGFALPDWDEALEIVRRAAAAFLPTRTIGWDVGFTTRGPVVVEANPNWAPWPGTDLAPVIARMRRAAAE